ncbi:MAG: hypothetical protein J6S19_08685 [Lentisphaeria bacterium]|nr:hypothetical protein [Lentisphaeria bacterium]
MNKYDYLIGTHDLETLTDWGPFARDIYALSHIADRARGVKFDFCFVPGLHHRAFFPPETLRECNCSPMEAAPDLSYFSFRQQLDSASQDMLYCNETYANIDKDLWLGRCEFVNNSDNVLVNNLLVCVRLASRPDVVPFIPETARFVDALSYVDLQYSYERFDHNLVHCGGRRGEQNFPGTVKNRCLGRPYYGHMLPCFAARKGDTVTYKLSANAGDQVIYARISADAGQTQDLEINVNGNKKILTVNGSGNFEIVELYRGELALENIFTITSAADSCGVRIDGYVLGQADLTAEKINFAPIGKAISPTAQPGKLENSTIYSGNGLDHSYCVWWSQKAAAERTYWVDNFAQFVNYNYGLRQPYYTQWDGFGKDYCRDSYILPIKTAAHSTTVIYTLYSSAADADAAAAAINAIDKSNENLEKLYLAARKRAVLPHGTDAGKKYELSQQIMAATALTNINFPISKQGNNIRHHVPDKFFNSLYSWDSGFIGLGFLELDKTRAIENLNVYVTDPGDENKFLLYGTPMPVQIYLYAEIWNRYQDREMLEFFYPRLLQFYKFIAGHYATSSYRQNKSNLLMSWDYFYNSGGWDDYPPQWYIHKNRISHIAPTVTTAHAIRFARILLQAAAELGITADKAMLEEDIKVFSEALQKYSWSEKDSIFSYVEHDENGNASCHWLDPASKVNFNFGMDGTTPLVAGICSKTQRDKLFGLLADPEKMWSHIGISTVDKSVPYFRQDGYWNGCVWMPHQWFFWKAALDDNRSEFARKIATVALEVWRNEVDQSRYCFEHFSMDSGRGAGCCHFGGLSSPVLNWYAAYHTPGRFTVGCDAWIKSQQHTENGASAELVISGNAGDLTTVLYVAGEGDFKAFYNGSAVDCQVGVPGCLEITLPKASNGTLEIKKL